MSIHYYEDAAALCWRSDLGLTLRYFFVYAEMEIGINECSLSYVLFLSLKMIQSVHRGSLGILHMWPFLKTLPSPKCPHSFVVKAEHCLVINC